MPRIRITDLEKTIWLTGEFWFANHFLSKRFLVSMNRWSKWANFIANRFRRVGSRFFSLRMFFLRSLALIRVLSRHMAQTSYFTSLSLRLNIKPILMQIAQNNVERLLTFSAGKRPKNMGVLSQQRGIRVDKTKLLRVNERLVSGRITVKQFVFQSSQGKFPRILERLRRTEIRDLANINRTKLPFMLMFDNMSNESASMWPHVEMKRMNSIDNSGTEDHSDLAKKSPPMIYHRLSSQNIMTSRQPDVSEDKVHEPRKRTEPVAPVNIDFITEEVIRQIDRRLLIWRERTGKV